MNQAADDHLRDASHFRGKADRIFLPTSEGEVASLLGTFQKQGISVTISGAGTGLTGARVPQGGVVLCTEKMNRILEVRWDRTSPAGIAIVEPGVTLSELDAALEPRGLFYPPDPGERKASLGGNVATNASGSRSFKYGPTRAYVQALRVVLASGEILEIRRGEITARQGILRIPFPAGASADLPVPTYRSRCPKNAAGYFAEDGMDLVDLFVGSEGTLGVVTRIELKVLPRPESVFSGILFFNTELDCFRFAAKAKGQAEWGQTLWGQTPEGLTPRVQGMGLSPRALEFFDSCSLRLLSEKHPDTPEHAGAALLFEQECSKSEQEALLQEWTGASESAGASASDCWFSHRPEDHREFRKFRYDLPVLVNEKVARNGFRKVGTDCAVPDPGAEEMFRFTLEELPKSQMAATLWGHLGDNHLHANFLPATQEEFKRALAFYERIARKAIQLGGTISAEHGIGKLRVPYLEMMVGREGLKEMARVKKGLDPRGILSPGNIFPIELLQEL